jgi:hypothetical protein
MDYGNLKVPESVTQEVQAILDSYEARNKEIENAHRKNTGRIWLGSALSGASALPVFNIPYVGTGLGGALYELGQGITEGDKLPELAKRTGTGFAIGETVGAIPYAGKYANKLSGGKIGNALTAGVEKIASTPLGQKVKQIAPKVEDLLMTDVTGNWIKGYHGTPYEGKIKKFVYDPKKQTGTDYGEAYYFTNNFDNASGYGYDVYKDPEIADIQTQQNLIKQKIIDAADIDDWDTVNKLSKQHKINNDKIFNIMQNGTAEKTGGQVIKANLDFKNPYIADAEGKNYYNVYDKYFEDARKAGNDSIIVKNVVDSARGLKPSDVYVAFKPEQIKTSLYNYLANDSVLTKGYRQNKDIIDKSLLEPVRKVKNGLNIFNKTNKGVLYDEIEEPYRIAEAEKILAQDIERHLKGEMTPSEMINFGKPSILLKNLGTPDLEMHMPQHKYDMSTERKMIQNNIHKVPDEIMKKIPTLLTKPKYVFKSSSKGFENKRFVVQVDAYDKDNNPVFVIVDYSNPTQGINIIPSIYGKEQYNNFINKNIDNIVYKE